MTSTDTLRAIQIQPGGLTTVQHIPAGGEGVRGSIGCRTFDLISLEHGIDLWVDDEGLLQAEPVLNLAATILTHGLGVQTAIFGTAVVLCVDLTTGESISLTDRQVRRIREAISTPDPSVIGAVVRTLGLLVPGR